MWDFVSDFIKLQHFKKKLNKYKNSQLKWVQISPVQQLVCDIQKIKIY